MNGDTIQNLLSQVNAINKKFEEIAEITGENFNIFNILGLTTNEVRTHSAFIAELLNPKGSHGQKHAFLSLFIEQLNIKGFNCKQATVEIEKFTGFISNDYTEGGNIDIIITDNNKKAIIIENKIYAGDQEKQLLRYHNYGKKYYPNSFELLYLTLDEKDASERSKCGLNDTVFTRISYVKHILEWLEKCRREAVNHSLLRETITQYINLVKHLTNQTINEKMKEEVINLLINSFENYQSAETITNSFNEVKNSIKVFIFKELNDRLTNLYTNFAKWKEYDINCCLDEDSTSFFFGVYASLKGGDIDNQLHEFNILANILKSNNSKFKRSSSFFGWIDSRYFRYFFDLENEKIYNMYTNKVARENFIDEIVEEFNVYINALKNGIEHLNNSQ